MRVDESPRTVDTMWEATEFESIAEQIPSYLGVQLSNATSLTAQQQKITSNVQCVDSGNFSCIRNSETTKASFKLEVFVGHNLVWVFAPGLFLFFFLFSTNWVGQVSPNESLKPQCITRDASPSQAPNPPFSPTLSKLTLQVPVWEVTAPPPTPPL